MELQPNMTMKLHHIGIVVPKIDNSIQELVKFFDFDDISKINNIPSQKVDVCFMKIGETRLELIEGVGIDSPVYNFTNIGGGIHHMCFEIKDIYETIKELKKNGATVIVNPVKGFENRLIAFLYLNMKNTNCNLIELAEEKARF